MLSFMLMLLFSACQTDTIYIYPENFDFNSVYETVPLGTFVNGSGDGDRLSKSSKIVSVPYIIMLPYQGVDMMAKLPEGYEAKAVTGTTSKLGSYNYWKGNMEPFDIPSAHTIFRLQFRKADNSDLSASTVTDLVSSGDITVLYKRIDLNVVERNYENEKYVKAACYKLGWDSSQNPTNQGLHAMPIFAHISDVHGDFKRLENCIEYANALGVDAIINTGDNVLYDSKDEATFQVDVLRKYRNIPYITCIGNHEVYTRQNGAEGKVTSEELIDRFITPYVTQYSYMKAAESKTDNAFYYVDFGSRKIRVIVLNQYDNACYWGAGCGGRLGQEQVTWFCNTLLNTPEEYGVIVVLHSPEDRIDTPEEFSSWNQTVNYDGRNEDTDGYAVEGLYTNSIRPIEQIIDAFISRKQLCIAFQENTRQGNNGEDVAVNIDFSSLAKGVEFLCYMSGHRHKDNIGYLHRAENRQLMLNIVCGNPYYATGGGLAFSEGCDLPRGDRGLTQDAFNIYAIDRQDGCVRIARVGSSVSFEGIHRDFLIAPYRNESN